MFELSNVGVLAALAAGFISFLSPCVLPVVPGYISYISGNTLKQSGRIQGNRLSILLLSGVFVLGFSTVFIALGASATAVSRLLLSYRYESTILGGSIIILFGVMMTGIVPMPWFNRDLRYHGNMRTGRPFGAYVLGLAFGFGWTPCIGPVLGAILTVAALSSTSMTGITLLAIYSIGLGLPFLLSAMFTDSLLRRRKAMGRTGRILQIGGGVVMIAMGFATVTGYMSVMSYWLLENFPVLSTIG